MYGNREESVCPGCWSDHSECAPEGCCYCGVSPEFHYSIVRAETSGPIAVDLPWEAVAFVPECFS